MSALEIFADRIERMFNDDEHQETWGHILSKVWSDREEVSFGVHLKGRLDSVGISQEDFFSVVHVQQNGYVLISPALFQRAGREVAAYALLEYRLRHSAKLEPHAHLQLIEEARPSRMWPMPSCLSCQKIFPTLDEWGIETFDETF